MKKKICARCHRNQALSGRSRCAGCLKKTRTSDRRRRTRLRRLQLCPECGARPKAGRKFCAKHLKYHATWNREHRAADARKRG
jgi:hypothetical protein